MTPASSGSRHPPLSIRCPQCTGCLRSKNVTVIGYDHRTTTRAGIVGHLLPVTHPAVCTETDRHAVSRLPRAAATLLLSEPAPFRTKV